MNAILPRLPVLLLALGAGAWAAESVPRPPDRIIELPPMIITDTIDAVPWLYVSVGDTEFLSRCSREITREFITTQLEIHHTLRDVIPPEFLATTAIPRVFLLLPIEHSNIRDDAVLRAMVADASRPTPRGVIPFDDKHSKPSLFERVLFLPNQRLEDRDTMAAFTFLKESNFASDRMIVAPDYVRSLLARRTPMLPQWLIEGLTLLYQQTIIRAGPAAVVPGNWISPEDTVGLRNSPDNRRVLLSCEELFAVDALIGPDHQHPTREIVWRLQAALFVRWALDHANTRGSDVLWKLADRVSREPMTEKILIEYFGLGYSDLLERLSDYLPNAVKYSAGLSLKPTPDLLLFEITPATKFQIARLRGEWERLEIPFVRAHHPKFLPHYIDRARLTFRRAIALGGRDPQFLASFGLCELDAGDIPAALPSLEAAMAAKVFRPRVYFEVARLRMDALARHTPKDQQFSPGQLQPILEPLHTAIGQSPPLPEVYILAMDAWLRCQEPTPPGELTMLVEAAPLFRRHPGFALRLALLQIKNGQRTAAAATLTTGLQFLGEPSARSRYQQALAGLAAPTATP